MVLDTEISIVKQIEIPEALIMMRSDGIVHVLYKENTTLDVELQMRTFKIFKEFTNNKKANFIFESDEGFVLSKEARENSKNLEEDTPVNVSAIIVKNLASRIIANFYVKVVKPKIRYKLFGNTKDAAEWLNSL